MEKPPEQSKDLQAEKLARMRLKLDALAETKFPKMRWDEDKDDYVQEGEQSYDEALSKAYRELQPLLEQAVDDTRGSGSSEIISDEKLAELLKRIENFKELLPL